MSNVCQITPYVTFNIYYFTFQVYQVQILDLPRLPISDECRVQWWVVKDANHCSSPISFPKIKRRIQVNDFQTTSSVATTRRLQRQYMFCCCCCCCCCHPIQLLQRRRRHFMCLRHIEAFAYQLTFYESVGLSVCPSVVCPSVILFVFPSISLSVYLSVSLFIYHSVCLSDFQSSSIYVSFISLLVVLEAEQHVQSCFL